MGRDRESPWLIGVALAFAIACGAFGVWLWSLILGGVAR